MKSTSLVKNIVLAALLLFGLATLNAQAHVSGISQNRLDVVELGQNKYDIKWRSSVYDLNVRLPSDCKQQALLNVWQCSQSLNGREIFIENLLYFETEAIVRVEDASGTAQVTYLAGVNNSVKLQGISTSKWLTFKRYLVLGVEHILLGIDHLLFIFGLMLILVGWRALLVCITSFTLAHSITLILSSLNVLRIPIEPTEAVIALSIVLLAAEYSKARKGNSSFIQCNPALIGFGIGLLHGLGFASVLKDIGLPTGEYLVALVSFNVGVEVGQVFFITVVTTLIHFLKPIMAARADVIKLVGMYALGGLAAYWFAERTTAAIFG